MRMHVFHAAVIEVRSVNEVDSTHAPKVFVIDLDPSLTINIGDRCCIFVSKHVR